MSSRVLLLHLDGSIPNLALMRLAGHHLQRGDRVELRYVKCPEQVERRIGDAFDTVYASAIFDKTGPIVKRLLRVYPDAIVGGTGWNMRRTLEDLGITSGPDYSLYPRWRQSIGFTQRGCRLKCEFCLVGGSLVVTDEGVVPIEDVKVGQMVLTHRGRYRPVTAVMTRKFVGNVYRLRAGALADLFPLSVTGEHPIWTRRVSYRSGGQKLTGWNWRDADVVDPGHRRRSRDVFAYPRTTQEEMPDAADMPLGDPGKLNEHLMTLVGWYLAEGYTCKSKKRGVHRTTFCLGHSEAEMGYARQIQSAAAALGARAAIYRPSIGIRVCIEAVAWARWFRSQFGHKADGKRLPLWVRLLPKALLAPLVQAWNRGDGCEAMKKGTMTWRGNTVSMNLAIGMRELFLKLGHACTINRHSSSDVIQGRKVASRPGFTVISHPQRAAKRSIVADEVGVYEGIKASSLVPYDGHVYDIEVEEDHSFCTPAFCVKNCVVPRKEGAVKEVATIQDIWRGPGHPKELILLDNDFFGQAHWRERIREIRDGGYKVNFNQGINARMLSEEAAEAIASVDYRDVQMKTRRIYTAWDSRPDEEVLFRGLERLRRAGVKPDHVMVYMLIGYWPGETEDDWLYRQQRLREWGARPYPMTYHRNSLTIGFQRWVVGAYDKVGSNNHIPWPEWKAANCDPRRFWKKRKAILPLPLLPLTPRPLA